MKSAPAMPMDLFFVRHGESEGNVALAAARAGDRSLITDEYRRRSAADYRLTDAGREQAQRAGDWVRKWMADVAVEEFDRLYCSPFIRTRETAAHLGLPDARWRLEPLLRERDWGLWEGQPREDSEKVYPESFALRQRYKFLWRPEGGESTADLDLRVREMFATFARELPGGRVLCVTHEDVMWAVRFRLEKMTIERWHEHVAGGQQEIVNCGILQYTRATESGELADRFHRVRLIDPDRPDEAQWQTITRPRFTNEELLLQVHETKPLRQLS